MKMTIVLTELDIKIAISSYLMKKLDAQNVMSGNIEYMNIENKLNDVERITSDHTIAVGIDTDRRKKHEK